MKRIGQVYSVDQAGRLPKLGQPPGPPWQDQLAIRCRGIRTGCPDVLSIAVRGSLARGTAVPGISDIDMVAIFPDPPDAFKRFRDWPETEIHLVSLADLLVPKRPATAFALAFSGATLWGRDVVAELPAPQLDRRAVAHLKAVPRWLPIWEPLFDDDTNDHLLICRRLMKRIVRSLFEAVMLDLGIYARDIHPCAETAAAAFPAQAQAIWQAARWVVAPTQNRAEIAALVAELAPLLNAQHAVFRLDGSNRTG